MMSVCLLRCPVSGGEWWGRIPDEWTCPDEIAHLGITVLYRAVACWGLYLDRPVSVADVSQAFAIQERRASDVLHYITHTAQYVRAVNLPPGRGRKRMVRVLSVASPLVPCRQRVPTEEETKPLPASRKKDCAGESGTLALRRWFVSRRRGEKVPGMVG
ncbi:CaiF/GrlA family transcriptional regulator [Salmonella enterica]|nr:CaiF/GrlA family transcriptional regulator [Salmonella enterica]ECW9136671.1 CaiF/GrlA family transcriptional regulator [Salmonella enterica]ECZ6749402.1 CaiF/GrlA family transcriptional regulator [Salmonella enterica]